MIKRRRSAKLFYLVGPSGSGKDSILRYFRQHLSEQCVQPVTVSHRYITRASDSNENSVSLSEEEFRLRLDKELFAMHWQANGFDYGIGKEIELWMKAGVSVIVNGSRAYLPKAQSLWGKKLHSISVNVSDEVLEQRLRQRNRESEGEIQLRLQRHKRLQPESSTDSVVVNNSSVENAAKQLQEVINQQLV